MVNVTYGALSEENGAYEINPLGTDYITTLNDTVSREFDFLQTVQ